MITKICYYEPKNRIYISLTERKTDAYFDLDAMEWNPKKIGKDGELLKEIFKFAGIENIEQFCKIRGTRKQSKDPLQSKLCSIKEELSKREYYFVGDVYRRLKAEIEGIKVSISDDVYKEFTKTLKEKRIVMLTNKISKVTDYMFDARTEESIEDKYSELVIMVSLLNNLGVDVINLEKELTDNHNRKMISFYSRKANEYVGYIEKDYKVNENTIKTCNNLINKLSKFDSKESIEIKTLLEKTIDNKNEEIKELIKTKIKELIEFAPITIQMELDSENNKSFKLVNGNSFDKEDYETIKRLIKQTSIGYFDGYYAIIINIDLLEDYGVPYTIVYPEIELKIKYEEVKKPYEITILQDNGTHVNMGKKQYVAECDSLGEISNFITEFRHFSSTGKTAEMYIDKNYVFDGFYKVRYGSWSHLDTSIYKVAGDKWELITITYTKIYK